MKNTTYAALLTAILCSSTSIAATMELPTLTTNPKSESTTPSQVDVAKKDLFERTQWGLSEAQWQRYKAIVSTVNPTSIYLDVDNTSPYRVLYDYERDMEKKYQLALKDAIHMEKMLSSDADYMILMTLAKTEYEEKSALQQAEETKLTMTKTSIAGVQLPPLAKLKTDRHILFVKGLDSGTCNTECLSDLSSAVISLKPNDQMDIFYVGSSKNKLVELINAIGITKAHLSSKTVSVQMDNGEASRLGVTSYPTSIHMDSYGNARSTTF